MGNSSERLGVGTMGSTARELMTGAGAEALVLTNLSNGRICEVSYTSLGAIVISEWYTREAERKGFPLILEERTDWDNWRLPTDWERSFYDMVERYAEEGKLEEYHKRKNGTGYDLVNMDYAMVLGGDDVYLSTTIADEGRIRCMEICNFSNVQKAKSFGRLCEIQTSNAGRVCIEQVINSLGGLETYSVVIK